MFIQYCSSGIQDSDSCSGLRPKLWPHTIKRLNDYALLKLSPACPLSEHCMWLRAALLHLEAKWLIVN